ncbi:hypothetical protein MMC25_002714 [Agyrium rufum]|nr:hypothetical protein [Agyrium rufum]
MEASPLVQQARPSFRPKICDLYDQLFIDDDDEDYRLGDGFWNEFFLLKPDRGSFYQRLDTLKADDLLHYQAECQHLFHNAVRHVQQGRSPSDAVALETLTVFLSCVLSKRYTNPSADVIAVLAGLHHVDAVLSEFANAIEDIIRSGRNLDVRRKAIQVSLSLTSGAYQTSLVSYFTHRDLFPALIKYIQDLEEPSEASEAFVLLGLLANYNKFEYRNPYRQRLADFVNQDIIRKLLRGVGSSCTSIRTGYSSIQEDVPETWNLSNALTSLGLGILAPVKAIVPLPEADTNEQYGVLPSSETAVFLATYDFADANRMFASELLMCPADSKAESPSSAFLSSTSYILHHAFRSSRATTYGLLNLTILRIAVEDPSICKQICNEDMSIAVRFCRQRQPFLPPESSKLRPVAAHILDIALDAINHNIRRRLDFQLYASCIMLTHRLLCHLSTTRTHLKYHWSLLWHSLLSLVRFLIKYESDIKSSPANVTSLLTPLLKCLALAIANGNAFLPSPAVYDDLIYKLVEINPILPRFKHAYLSFLPPSEAGQTSPIDIIIQVAAHYDRVLEEEKKKGKFGKTMSPDQVSKVIRQGYESLDVPGLDNVGSGAGTVGGGLDDWERWREGDERGFVKKVGRTVVEDVKKMVREF